MRAEGLSYREIAKRARCSLATVAADLAPAEPGPPPAPAGNDRAMTHGATAEKRLAPIRDEMAVTLRERWPWLDEIRLALLADRMARFESARRWLDEQPGGVVRDEKGDVFPIVDRSEKWANRIEALVADLEQEHRVRQAQAGGVDAYLAANPDEPNTQTTTEAA